MRLTQPIPEDSRFCIENDEKEYHVWEYVEPEPGELCLCKRYEFVSQEGPRMRFKRAQEAESR